MNHNHFPAKALIVLDLMDRIAALPLSPYSGETVVARCCQAAESFRTLGGQIIWVRVERPHVEVQPPGSGFISHLPRLPKDKEIVKKSFGAFANTGLEEFLRQQEINELWLCGIATNLAIESTARWASDLGYKLVFLEDCMSGLHPGHHEFSVQHIFPLLGKVVQSSEVLSSM